MSYLFECVEGREGRVEDKIDDLCDFCVHSPDFRDECAGDSDCKTILKIAELLGV